MLQLMYSEVLQYFVSSQLIPTRTSLFVILKTKNGKKKQRNVLIEAFAQPQMYLEYSPFVFLSYLPCTHFPAVVFLYHASERVNKRCILIEAFILRRSESRDVRHCCVLFEIHDIPSRRYCPGSPRLPPPVLMCLPLPAS